MSMKRSRAAELGRDTVRILRAGRYEAPSGAVVDIADALRRAVADTVTYPPDERTPNVPTGDKQTTIEVANVSTLAAARELVVAGCRPVALNFASARHPGGGFLGGALAQEESLARSSGLFACIEGNPMYDHHARIHDTMYTDYAIYSPDVPVIRDDDGALLEQPYPCAFITSPAANAKVVLERDRRRGPEIESVMRGRVDKVLAIAAAHGHDAAVLGAWGCGVFGNDCGMIAGLFREALTTQFAGAFARVVFAILDTSREQRFIGPFREAFVG
jgi:uncharacterized protein (TIGR02452 family)